MIPEDYPEAGAMWEHLARGGVVEHPANERLDLGACLYRCGHGRSLLSGVRRAQAYTDPCTREPSGAERKPQGFDRRT